MCGYMYIFGIGIKIRNEFCEVREDGWLGRRGFCFYFMIFFVLGGFEWFKDFVVDFS